jgi:thiamine biosynthesis lipoprotein
MGLIAAGLLALTSCNDQYVTHTDFVMNTVCTLRVGARTKGAVIKHVFDRMREIENVFSPTIDGTQMARVNAQASRTPVAVSDEFAFVLEAALRYAALSDGAFNPAIGPLAVLWGIGAGGESVPGDQAIESARLLCDWRDVVVIRYGGAARTTVAFARDGMRLDLGGIVKGYAADEAAAILRDAGITSAVIDLGGNVLVVGGRRAENAGSAAEQDWRVGIQTPLEARGAYLAVASLRDASIVTSGIYERFFIEAGVRYHHILSGVTGRPVDNGLLSVSAITAASIDADALSTTLFALGPERGFALAESLPAVEAVFVLAPDADGSSPLTLKLTSGAQGFVSAY